MNRNNIDDGDGKLKYNFAYESPTDENNSHYDRNDISSSPLHPNINGPRRNENAGIENKEDRHLVKDMKKMSISNGMVCGLQKEEPPYDVNDEIPSSVSSGELNDENPLPLNRYGDVSSPVPNGYDLKNDEVFVNSIGNESISSLSSDSSIQLQSPVPILSVSENGENSEDIIPLPISSNLNDDNKNISITSLSTPPPPPSISSSYSNGCSVNSINPLSVNPFIQISLSRYLNRYTTNPISIQPISRMLNVSGTADIDMNIPLPLSSNLGENNNNLGIFRNENVDGNNPMPLSSNLNEKNINPFQIQSTPPMLNVCRNTDIDMNIPLPLSSYLGENKGISRNENVDMNISDTPSSNLNESSINSIPVQSTSQILNLSLIEGDNLNVILSPSSSSKECNSNSYKSSFSYEGKGKRKNDNSKASPKKRNKLTSKSNCKYNDDKTPLADKGIEASNEERDKYLHLINEEDECDHCHNEVSKSELFRYDNGLICIDCTEKCFRKGIIQYITELGDYFEDESIDFDGEDFYKCHRIKHDRPKFHFIKYQKTKDKYIYQTCCTYCRLIKRIEHVGKCKSETQVENNDENEKLLNIPPPL